MKEKKSRMVSSFSFADGNIKLDEKNLESAKVNRDLPLSFK